MGAPSNGDTSSAWYFIWSFKWYITGFFGLLLSVSLITILKIKWQWVLAAIIATAASAYLSVHFIENQKLVPLVPVIVGLLR
jgi:hypothetical protein